jgi:predicted SPOUT superfamily RNA methylase MTH1
VDEVVVYDDGTTNSSQIEENGASTNGGTSLDDPNQFLVHLLSYLEIPTQLRQYLFLPNAEPAAAKNLPNLELPHHLKSDEWCIYQEGVTLPGADEYGTLVEIGQRRPVAVKAQIPANTRVTLKFQEGADVAYHAKRDEHVLAEPVNPDEPREEAGLYWGYKVRRAGGLSQVFTECEYEDGYDISIGTSDSGASIETIYSGDEEQKISRFKHLMVVFGGPEGLEAAVRNDSDFQKLDVNNAKDIFDRWINICPGQGSRTIRTEEAMWIGLAGLQRLVARNASD